MARMMVTPEKVASRGASISAQWEMSKEDKNLATGQVKE